MAGDLNAQIPRETTNILWQTPRGGGGSGKTPTSSPNPSGTGRGKYVMCDGRKKSPVAISRQSLGVNRGLDGRLPESLTQIEHFPWKEGRKGILSLSAGHGRLGSGKRWRGRNFRRNSSQTSGLNFLAVRKDGRLQFHHPPPPNLI